MPLCGIPGRLCRYESVQINETNEQASPEQPTRIPVLGSQNTLITRNNMPSGDVASSSSAGTPLDVNVLKEIAKKDLIDALNSVSRTVKPLDIGTVSFT